MLAPALHVRPSVPGNATKRHLPAVICAASAPQTALQVHRSVGAQAGLLQAVTVQGQHCSQPASALLPSRLAKLYPAQHHDTISGQYTLFLTHLASKSAAHPLSRGISSNDSPGVLEDALADLAEARPAILETRQQLQAVTASAQVIAQHLQVGTAQALRVLSAAPQLLGMGPDMVAERLAMAFELMDMTAPAVRRLLASFPHLLNLSPHVLAGHFDDTREFLGMGQPAMQALVLKWPGILTLDPQQCVHRLERLCSVLGQKPKAVMAIVKRCPLMLSQNPETLTNKLSHLSSLLGLSQEELERVVYTYPTLLLCASSTVSHNAGHLAQLLQLPDTRSLRPLVTKMPNLLGFSGATLAEKLSALQQAMGLSRDMIVAMALARPAVLASSCERLCRTWASLRALASTHPAWQEKLEGGELRVSSLGLLVTVSERRLWRLHYLAAQGLQGSCQITTAVTLSDAAFHSKFPGYEQWQHQQREEQQRQQQALAQQEQQRMQQQQAARQKEEQDRQALANSNSTQVVMHSPASPDGTSTSHAVNKVAPMTHASRLRAAISNRSRLQPSPSPSSQSLITAR